MTLTQNIAATFPAVENYICISEVWVNKDFSVCTSQAIILLEKPQIFNSICKFASIILLKRILETCTGIKHFYPWVMHIT
jgi:hypothetical protein